MKIDAGDERKKKSPDTAEEGPFIDPMAPFSEGINRIGSPPGPPLS